jgi:hypothetical protein
MVSTPVTIVEFGPAWEGPSSVGAASYGFSFDSRFAYFLNYNTNGTYSGWVAAGEGVIFDRNSNRTTGGTFNLLSYYKEITPVSYFDETKKRDILGDFDYKDSDYSVGVTLANPLNYADLRGKLSGGLSSLLSGKEYIAGNGYGTKSDYGIYGYGGDDTLWSGHARLASGGDGNDTFDGLPQQRAVLIGGAGNDKFDGYSGTAPSEPYYLLGGAGINRYEGPNKSAVVIVDQKKSAGQADIILDGGTLLYESSNTKVIINSNAADASKLSMHWVNADINEISLVDRSIKLTRLAEGGYISVTLDGVEQVKISVGEGTLESEFIRKKDIIAKKIGIGEVSTLINTENFSENIIAQIKSELGLASLNYSGDTLTKNIESNGANSDQPFSIKSIAQEDGVLTLRFNKAVGTTGSLFILESKADGSLVGTTSRTVSDIKVSGEFVTAKLNTSTSGNEKLNYMLWFVSGWTSSTGESLPGQGNPQSVASDAYGFTYQRDLIAPTLTSAEVLDGKTIRLRFSEAVVKDGNGNWPAYVVTTPNPRDMSDVVISSVDIKVNGNQVEITLPSSIDGNYFLSHPGFKDLAGNSYWSTPLKLSFIDPAVSARRIKLDRSKDNNDTFLLPIELKGTTGQTSIERIELGWQPENIIGSSIQEWFSLIELEGKQKLTGIIDIDQFTAEGIHRLNKIDIQFKSRQSIRYDTQAEINTFLKQFGLEQGSLDVEVKGQPEISTLKITDVKLSSQEWDPNNQTKATYVDVNYSYESSLKELNGRGQLETISLRYKLIGGTGYESIVLRGESIHGKPGKASFLVQAEQQNAIKAGGYELESVSYTGYPHLYNQVELNASSDEFRIFNSIKNLKITSDWVRPTKKIERELLNIELTKNKFDLTPIAGQSFGGSGFLINAEEIVTIPAEGIDILINEGISINFESEEYTNWLATNETNKNYEWRTLYTRPSATLTTRSIDLLDNGRVLIKLSGYLSVPANTREGNWKYSSVSLYNNALPSYIGDSIERRDPENTFSPNNFKPDVLQKLNNDAFSVQGNYSTMDYGAVTFQSPILEAASGVSYSVDASTGAKEIALDIIIQDPYLNPNSKSPSYLDFFLGNLDNNENIENTRLRGIISLLSPSGTQYKTILLDDNSLVSYGQAIKGINAPGAELIRYAPKISFSPNDESGTWRVSQIEALTSDNWASGSAVGGDARNQGDTKLSMLNTLGLAKKTGLKPSSLEVNVKSINNIHTASPVSEELDIKNLDIKFSTGSVDLASSAKASIDLIIKLTSNRPLTSWVSSLTGNTLSSPIGFLELVNTKDGIANSANTISATIKLEDIATTSTIDQAGKTVYSSTISKSIELGNSLQSGLYTVGRLLVGEGIDNLYLDGPITNLFYDIIDIRGLIYPGDTSGYRVSITDAIREFAAHQVELISSQNVDKASLSFLVTNGSDKPSQSQFHSAIESLRFLSQSVLITGLDKSIDLQIDKTYLESVSNGLNFFVGLGKNLILASDQGNYKIIPITKDVLKPTTDGIGVILSISLDDSFAPGRWFAIGITNFTDDGYNSLLGSMRLEDGISSLEAESLHAWFGANSSFQITSNSIYRWPSTKRASIVGFEFKDNVDIIATASPTITLGISAASIAEDSSTNLTYTFSRTGSTINALTVNYNIGGTTVSADYTGATPGTGKTITFAKGAATATLTIDPIADASFESDETIILTLSTGTDYTADTSASVMGMILNDDSLQTTYTLISSASSVNEESTISYNLTTTNVASGTSLYYQFSGAGINAADFSSATTIGTEVVASNGQLTISRTLTADKTTEGNENLTLKVFSDSAATTPLAINSGVTVNDTSLTPSTPSQKVYTEKSEISYKPTGVAALPLLYTTSSNDANLSGLTLNVHYNSSILIPSGANNGVSGQVAAAITKVKVLPDTSNSDGDPLTDKIVQLLWATFDNSFPNKTLPTTIATVSFDTSATNRDPVTGQPLTTTVRYTSSETSAGYDFLTGSTTFKAQQFDLDVDGDGKVTALGDGLMVIRKLFGSAFSGDDLTAKAISPNASRTTADIHDFILEGINSGILDVDKDGKTTALGDGLMVIRRLFGSAFEGSDLTNKAISPGSPYFGPTADFASVAFNIDSLRPTFI